MGNNTAGEITETACVCGINSEANKYCNIYAGDAPGANWRESQRNFIASGFYDRCNTMRRYSLECQIMGIDTKEGLQAFIALVENAYYPYLINNDACV